MKNKIDRDLSDVDNNNIIFNKGRVSYSVIAEMPTIINSEGEIK